MISMTKTIEVQLIAQKNVAFKRLVSIHNLNIILLQKLMSEGDKIVSNLNILLGDYGFSYVHLRGRSRCLVAGWKNGPFPTQILGVFPQGSGFFYTHTILENSSPS
jgi:hypothetical protein